MQYCSEIELLINDFIDSHLDEKLTDVDMLILTDILKTSYVTKEYESFTYMTLFKLMILCENTEITNLTLKRLLTAINTYFLFNEHNIIKPEKQVFQNNQYRKKLIDELEQDNQQHFNLKEM